MNRGPASDSDVVDIVAMGEWVGPAPDGWNGRARQTRQASLNYKQADGDPPTTSTLYQCLQRGAIIHYSQSSGEFRSLGG